MAHRPRLPPPADAEHYDDLSELERERHENDMRLKNTFEHIFDKYERDFTEIGDEVDLETGEIIVNNGHLARLEDERDTGEGFEEWYEEDEEDVDDVIDGYPYERYELGDSQEEDELLSSPPGIRNRRMDLPGEALASLSTLTWQTSTIHPPPNAMTPHPRNQPQHRNHPQHRGQPQHQNPPRPTRTPRPPLEPQQTPQRMNLAQDPAFAQNLGQIIAQGIAQYMSSYQDSPRSTDPVWDAPPLPRPSQSARRPAPPPQRRRQMIPESPRQPYRSLWSTGRGVGRPRAPVRRPEQIPDPSPSIRNTTLPRQILANAPPDGPRYAVPQWDEVDYEEEGEESFDEPEEDGLQVEDMGGIEYEDQDQANTWADDEDVMDLEQTAQGETTEIEDIGNPDSFQAPDDAPMKTQKSRTSRHSPDPTSIMPSREVAGPADNGAADAGNTHTTPVAQPSPVGSNSQTPRGNTGKKLNKQPAWIEGDNELFIVLKEDRKLSTAQICRYFPDRTPKNLENHWYKRLAVRPDKTRGPMSDYVRQALERGPILANKVRQKPYVPKNPERAKPHLANLADPTEMMTERPPTEVPDSESDRSSQDLIATPAAQVLPINESSSKTVPTVGDGEEGIVSTGDTKRPWGCGKCGARWTSKKGAKYHFAVPERCAPQSTRKWNRGRKPHHIVPEKAEPPKLVLPGVDISTGRPAPFNPNILIREDMERTHFCILCGKSWASHSNAREHTRRPELCKPENWLTNYEPGAHRKRVLPVNGIAQEGQPSKRQKKDNSATNQLLEAAGGCALQVSSNDSPVTAAVQRAAEARSQVAQPMNEVPSPQDVRPEPVSAPLRGLPKRFTISDKQPVAPGSSKQAPIDLRLIDPRLIDPKLIDTSKVMEAVQQHTGLPQQVLGISPPIPKRSKAPVAKMISGETSAAGAAALARNRIGLSNNEVQTPSARNQNTVGTPVQQAAPLTQAMQSQGENRPTVQTQKRPNQVVGTNSTPGNGSSAAASSSVPTVHVSKSTQKSSQRPNQAAGASSTPRNEVPAASSSAATKKTPKPSQKASQEPSQVAVASSTPKNAASSSAPTTQASKPLQKPSQRPNQVAGAGSTPRIEVSAASSSGPSTQVSKLSQKPSQRPNQVAEAGSTPRKEVAIASSPAPSTKGSKSWQKPSLPQPISKTVANARVKATPAKPVPKMVVAQASQSAKPASKASSVKRLPAKAGPTATPRTKVTDEAACSSPLRRIVKSEPRPSASFIDLLADESEDELAL